MLRKVPLIVILGSTGTGKTKLSLELAERFGGEIISADSMQVYANLDIVTAKASREEQARARHHLLDVATPAEPFTVLHFRNAALPIIDQLLAQSKSPIVVGGTNYYIESLLWETLVSPAVPAGDRTPPPPPPGEVGLTEAAMDAMPAALLHQHLQAVDPGSARRIHPNNKRKIVRAIEVFQQSGQTLSALLEQQRRRPGANRLGGPLRYPHTVLFWLRCQQDVLNERLDRRVDGMLEQGLLREVRAFHAQHMGGARDSSAYTKGVLQTIGFKEFLPYLERFDAANDRRIEEYLRLNGFRLPPRGGRPGPEPTEAGPALPPGLDVLGACLDELKLVTRRYSRKQIKWINNRFLASPDRQVPDLYELDTSDVAAWDERVLGRAAAVVESYRRGATCEVEPMPRRRHPGAGLEEETSNFCAVCERTFVGEFQWQLHLRSNKHKRRKEGQRKRARLEGAQGGPEGVKKERKEGNNESEGAQEDSGGVEMVPEAGKEEPEVAPEADSRP